MLDDDDESESPKSRTGRFFVPHRGDTRVEVGEPIHCGGDRPWLCAVKLVGRRGPDLDTDATQTLLVRTGRGDTPEAAQRAALAQVTLVYGSPVEPPPTPLITQMKSDPPPPLPRLPEVRLEPLESESAPEEVAPPSEPKRRGFFARLFGWLR